MTVMEHLPALAVLTPVVGALAVTLVASVLKRYGAGFAIMAATTTLTAVITGALLREVLREGTVVYGIGGWPPPLGVVYVVDPLSAAMGFLTSVMILLITIYSHRYFSEQGGLTYYYTLIGLVEAAIIGCFYTGDVFNFFVMVELMAVCAYALVSYGRSGIALEASIKYGLAAALAGILFFIGLAFTYGYLGTLNMADLAAKVQGITTAMTLFSGQAPAVGTALTVIAALITWALMIEAASFPLHFWLPDAHSEAPSPVSALLSGLVVNVGLYGMLRLYYTVFAAGGAGPLSTLREVVLAVSVIGSLYAAIMMLMQTDIKRLIAYSTVMHVSIISMGVSLGTAAALGAAVYHVFAHSVSKALAFLSAGLLVAAARSRRLTDLAGMGKIYPGVSAALIISLLGLAGVPPLGTFPSKLLLIGASLESGHYEVAASVVVSGAIAGVAYFRVINTLINREPVRAGVRGTPATAAAVIALLALATVAVGLALPVLSQYFTDFATQAMNPAGYVSSVEAMVKGFLGG